MRSFFFCLVLFVTPLQFFAASHVAKDTVSHSILGVPDLVPGQHAAYKSPKGRFSEGSLHRFKKRGIFRLRRTWLTGDSYASQSHDLGLGALIAVILFPLLALAPSAGFLAFFALLGIPLGIMAITKARKAKKMGSNKKDGKVMGIVALSLIAFGLIFIGALLLLALATRVY